MSDVRARIVEALQIELDEHGYEDDDEKRGQVAHHFADVLLSLPGIAIVAAANTLTEGVIAHVLADIDQVGDEDSWPLQQRLEVIQTICGGSEYLPAANAADAVTA